MDVTSASAGSGIQVPPDVFGTDTVEAIAGAVGYTSEYAFIRAFSRHRGEPPGRYRRLAQAAVVS